MRHNADHQHERRSRLTVPADVEPVPRIPDPLPISLDHVRGLAPHDHVEEVLRLALADVGKRVTANCIRRVTAAGWPSSSARRWQRS
jgi:hypothetical protein